MMEQEILNSYKQYNYLNKQQGGPLAKILVSYIKPSFLFKSDILTPIQLGKSVEHESSKDGVQSDENLNWLHENCELNDDFNGGISSYNRRIGFFTGTYWAWKNYEKLGNPQYFGSFGYRKLLPAIALENITDYDFILPEKQEALPSVKQQLEAFHGKKLVWAIEEGIKKFYPDELDAVKDYFNQSWGYFHELYIMKKDVFFEYCSWIYPLIQFWLKMDLSLKEADEEHKSIQQMYIDRQEIRDIAFMAERITGYYLEKLTKTGLKYKEVKPIILISEKQRQKQAFNILKYIRQNVSSAGKENKNG